jgi:hypothetical protein
MDIEQVGQRPVRADGAAQQSAKKYLLIVVPFTTCGIVRVSFAQRQPMEL